MHFMNTHCNKSIYSTRSPFLGIFYWWSAST